MGLARAVAAASDALNTVKDSSMNGEVGVTRQIFMSPVSDFDVVLHLLPKAERADFSSSKRFKNVVSKRAIGVDTLDLLVEQIKKRLEWLVAVFVNKSATSGPAVGLVWRPAAFMPSSLKVTRVGASCLG